MTTLPVSTPTTSTNARSSRGRIAAAARWLALSLAVLAVTLGLTVTAPSQADADRDQLRRRAMHGVPVEVRDTGTGSGTHSGAARLALVAGQGRLLRPGAGAPLVRSAVRQPRPVLRVHHLDQPSGHPGVLRILLQLELITNTEAPERLRRSGAFVCDRPERPTGRTPSTG